MKISDIIAMCVRNLTRRKFRTFLTVVGVVIGTCAIVVTISLGIGISASQDELMESFGDLTKIEVYGGWTDDTVLDDDKLAEFALLEGVDVVTPFVSIWNMDFQAELYAGKKQRYMFSNNMIGIYPEAMSKMGYDLIEGSYLDPTPDRRKIKAVMGSQAVYRFEDTKKRYPNNMIWEWEVDEAGNPPDPFFSPMGETYTLKVINPDDEKKFLEYDLEIIGIIGGSNDYDVQYSVYFDLADFNRIQDEFRKAFNIKKNSRNNNDSYNNVVVKAQSIHTVTTASEAIEAMGYNTWSLQQMREGMQQQVQTIQLILGALGGVSLFVAAISITNTMIMSVYERTREIGVMKVLGCLVGNIRTVFLCEAGMIGFFGGSLGIAVSFLLSYLMNTFGSSLGESLGFFMMSDETRFSIIPLWLVALGISFATLIGLVSGFYPANRAVRISALEAIKTE